MRKIVFTESFRKDLAKFLRQHKDLEKSIERVLNLLETHIGNPILRTHKLHGKLRKSYACSLNYEYRIAFTFDKNYVYIESIGSHDEIY